MKRIMLPSGHLSCDFGESVTACISITAEETPFFICPQPNDKNCPVSMTTRAVVS